MLGTPLRSRLCAAVLCGACVTCHAGALPLEPAHADETTGGAAAAETAAAETAASDASLDATPASAGVGTAASARPSEVVRAIRDALALGHDDAARALIADALRSASSDVEELAWLEARTSEDPTARLGALGRVVELGGPLAPWARVRRASALLDTDPEAAIPEAEAVATSEFPGRNEAADVLAIANARLGHEGAVAALEARTSTVARRALADLFAGGERDAQMRERAVELYRRLDAERPSSELSGLIDDLLASLPHARREALEEAPLDVALARAEALAAQYRHTESRVAFHRVAVRARAAHDLVTRCRADMGEGRAHYRERERREAIEILDAMAERCSEAGPEADDARAWGRYFAAKSFANLDERADSVERWDALADELPTHRLADDARVEAARLLLRMGDPARAAERLSAAIALGGDMRGEARFLVAWSARAEGDHDAALAALDASIAEGPGEDSEDARGRAAYWRARTLADLGRADEASAALAALAESEPLSYYGQQARARLFELAPGSVPALLDPRTAVPSPLATPSLDPDAVARLLALLRVGEASLAARELEALGVGPGGDAETGWWAASLYAESGATPRAVELARRSLETSLYTDVTSPAWPTRVAIAYPLGYRELVEPAAAAESIPASLVFAIAREESSFEPSAVSVAHAYGLLQIMRPTAAAIAVRLDLPSDIGSLARPDVSVRIGARYLGDLSRRYDPSPALVPSAYNAGQGAVDRWLRLRRDLPLDAFIEEIPYGETRRYTRRVLMSRGIYEWLREGELPRLPLDTPSRT